MCVSRFSCRVTTAPEGVGFAVRFRGLRAHHFHFPTEGNPYERAAMQRGALLLGSQVTRAAHDQSTRPAAPGGPGARGRTRSRVNVIADSASQNVYILPLKSCSSQLWKEEAARLGSLYTV